MLVVGLELQAVEGRMCGGGEGRGRERQEIRMINEERRPILDGKIK
jgi:hypothetical protein